MSGIAQRLHSWLREPLPAHAGDHLRVMLLMGAALTAGFGAYDLWRGAWGKGGGEAALSLLYGGIWLAARGGALRLVRGLVYPCLIAGYGFMLVEIGQDAMVASWLPVGVMTAFGLLGLREGTIWAVSVMLAAAAVFGLDAMRAAPVYTPEKALNIWLASALVAFMVYVAHGFIEQTRARLMAEEIRRRRREDARRISGGVAHLINNEMQAVVGHAEMALLEAGDGEQARDLDMVIRMARKASEHANRLVAYAREEECGGEVFSVAEVVKRAFEGWRKALPDGVLAQLAAASGALRCAGDASLLGEAVEGMLENAREAVRRRHGGHGGRVRVEVRERALARDCRRRGLAAGKYACIEIEDNGDGVPDGLREHMFEPFITTGEFGRGLGLAAAQGIVRSHGGAIEVERSDSGGALFRVWLPAVPA